MPLANELTGSGAAGQLAKAVLGSAGAVTAAGTAQATATPLGVANAAVTAAGSADGVLLPSNAQPGEEYWVLTVSSTTAKVYPGGADTINGSTSAISVAQNKMAVFKRFTATTWGAFFTA